MTTRPSNPQDAEKRLSDLAEGLQRHFAEYAPHETFVDHGLLKWLAEGIAERGRRKGTLDQALGLARYRGEKPSKPGKYFQLAVEVFEMRARGLSWAAVSEKTGFEDVRELQRICEREMEHVIQHYAADLARGVK